MPQLFRCVCGQRFQVRDEDLGKQVQCPRCKQRVQIPAGPPASRPPAPAPVQADPPRPAVEITEQKPSPAPLPVAAVPAPAPVRTPSPGSRLSSKVWLLAGAGVLVLAAGATALIVSLNRKKTPPENVSADNRPTTQTRTSPPTGSPTSTTPEPTRPPPSTRPTPTRPSPDPSITDRPVTPRVLETVNARREALGLPALTLDPALCAGCLDHARYLLRNRVVGTGEPLRKHEEGKPGFTPAGKKAAEASFIATGDPDTCLSDALNGLTERILLLSPTLRRVGIGAAGAEGGSYVVVDLTSGQELGYPVLYPADGQKDVPLAFPGKEWPNPVPEAGGKPTGYPVTASFPLRARVEKASGTLRDDQGRELPAWFSSPEKPANPDFPPRYQYGSLCLMAHEVLRPGITYTVEMKAVVDGQPWARTWKFTTLGETLEKQAEKFLDRVNAVRHQAGLHPLKVDDKLSKACLAHAAYIARHQDRQGINLTDEDPALEGFTADGQAIARRSWIMMLHEGPIDAVDVCLRQFLFRLPFLRLDDDAVGIGIVSGKKNGWLVWTRGRLGNDRREPCVWPPDGMKDVPTHYVFGEPFDPLPENKDRLGGNPVTVIFPTGSAITDVEAELLVNGQKLECRVWTPEKPLAKGYHDNALAIFAKRPLAPSTRHEVRVKARVAGKEWSKTWSFTTRAEPSPAEVVRLEVAAINRVRQLVGLLPVVVDEELSKACQAHADYIALNDGHPDLEEGKVHEQNDKLPGASAEGKRAAKDSLINRGGEATAGVATFLATFYHRVPLLDPNLTRIGIGLAYARKTATWATVVDVGSDRRFERVMVYPPEGATGMPRGSSLARFLAGPPQSISAQQVGRSTEWGLPVTLTYRGLRLAGEVRISLEDAAGNRIPGKAVLLKEVSSVALVPALRLEPKTTYKVTVIGTAFEKPYQKTWTFTTGE